MAQAGMRLRQEGKVPEGCGTGEGMLGRCERAVIVAHPQQCVGHQDRDASQPTLVAKGGGKCVRFAQVDEDLSILSECKEGTVESKGEPQIDGLFLYVALVGAMLQGDQR